MSQPPRMRGRLGLGPGHALAAAIGAPVVAWLSVAVLIRVLPLSEPAAFAVGLHLLVPLWATLACVLPLARSGVRACLGCVAAALALAVVSWL